MGGSPSAQNILQSLQHRLGDFGRSAKYVKRSSYYGTQSTSTVAVIGKRKRWRTRGLCADCAAYLDFGPASLWAVVVSHVRLLDPHPAVTALQPAVLLQQVHAHESFHQCARVFELQELFKHASAFMGLW